MFSIDAMNGHKKSSWQLRYLLWLLGHVTNQHHMPMIHARRTEPIYRSLEKA